MSDLDEMQARVARYYDNSIFDFESVRLSQYSPVEFAITARYLKQWIPEGATVADIGVGVGHYAELLARWGCSVYLVDISQRLLDAAYLRLQGFDLHERVAGVHRASATELDCCDAGVLDAVLFLGPLYHLCSLEQRQRAIQEAARVLKPNGLLFAAGINRLAYLRDLLQNNPHSVLPRQDFHRQFLQDGNLDPEHAAPIGYAHLTTSQEFRELFEAGFDGIALIGTESFANSCQEVMANLASTEVEAWLDLIEETGNTLEGLGMSDHFLYVGRRKPDLSIERSASY
ncbi:bifunctional 2-polyprenyl-6-hydroxyphenol methylase/3-demethylubiquinol 3-O-methyltransferase UbiG [Leptolyngbya sp. FACHB-261]|uniref:class I SAM-dependent methyltransferase n=1 Tax=Leptolyngbya sp. FACHB-261 TaxID=2692806 RepID=UPI001689855F|nr:class I SAM-dependent methyltransferase [Leptolyngbya sp. FACHB-261]MBD2099318.1 methyltransferase domain-containing protein [Leptolyngbya sp. FACHB-261]